MAFSERIRLLIDVVTGNSTSALGKLKTDLAATDGAFGKMKVGASAAGDYLKQNMALAATVAGGALVGFGVKAVSAFQTTALGAGLLSDQLGITAEDASRLQEVAGDLGISVDSVGAAINRMNRNAETTPGAFDDIGAAIVRNADGTIDTVATFESASEAINRIPDAAERANAAQQIFGRGWQAIAELIMKGAAGIEASLKGVEDAKIMSPEDIERAKDFRDTLDDLAGKWESFTIGAGGALVATSDFFGSIDRGANRIEGWIDDAFGDVDGAVGDLSAMRAELDDIDTTIYTMGPNLLTAKQQLVAIAGGADVMGDHLFTAAEKAAYATQLAKDAIAAHNKAMLDALPAARAIREEAQQSSTHLVEQSIAAGLAAAATGEYAKAQEEARQAVVDINAAMASADWGAADIQGATTALSGYRPAAEGLADVAQRSAEAFDSLKTSVAEVGFTFDVATEAGRANRDLLDEVAGSMDSGFIAAYDNADGSMRKFKKSAKALGDETLATLAKEMDLSAEQTAELATALGLTEGDYEARFKLAGAEEARLKLQLLQGAIEGLPPETQVEVQNLIINGDYEGALRVIKQYARDHPATTDLNANPDSAMETIRGVINGDYKATVYVGADTSAAKAALNNIPDETVYVNTVTRHYQQTPSPGTPPSPDPGGGGPRSLPSSRQSSGATYVTVNNNRADLTPGAVAAAIRMARAS